MASSSATTCAIALVAACLFLCCCAQLGVPGGWHKKTNTDDEHYHKLAHLAISQQVQGREFYDTVLKVTDVETQVRLHKAAVSN
ncbi:hypothetical protein HPB48_003536 [Haemaphysalis longicornis]|uniref:Uncharacterized protein n=1 Tax=Haemaphysalis longicornis TaxID=44386 RepID=A0A9J6GH77_HAELO|nr:hypothetical protein HPB48_003536 [Haemaphysalis longicornis]